MVSLLPFKQSRPLHDSFNGVDHVPYLFDSLLPLQHSKHSHSLLPRCELGVDQFLPVLPQHQHLTAVDGISEQSLSMHSLRPP